MKILYVAKGPNEVPTAVATIKSHGHVVMATDEEGLILAALGAWSTFGFEAIVVEKAEALDPYRGIIAGRNIPVGDISALTTGKLLTPRSA